MTLPAPSDGFYWAIEPWGAALRCAALDGVAVHLFTTRALTLQPGGAPSDGWTALAASLGVAEPDVVRLKQVHGCAVIPVERGSVEPPAHLRREADVLVSNDPARAIVVQAADCVPVLLADPVTGLVAAAHAGWRGTAARAVVAAVEALVARGASQADLIAAIGPSIGPCCYEVGEELRDGFRAEGHREADLARWFTQEPGAKPHLNLPRANRDQLIAAGLREANVHACGLCTACHLDVFYSFRREAQQVGRLAAGIRAL